MRWIPYVALPLAAAGVVQPAAATVFLSLEQAQQAVFPGAKFTPYPILLTPAQREQLKARSNVREPFRGERVWRTEQGGVFFVDEVVGKHELIKYALGVGPDGAVTHVEIMEYYETYGGEVRDAAWRKQFEGKTVAAPLVLNQDIKNISGATLSSKHITDGVKRLLVVYDLALKGKP